MRRRYHIVHQPQVNSPVTDFPDPLRLTHMTWPEVESARDSVRLVAIPLGSIEQHGPNSSFDTDSVIVEELTLRMASRFHPQILVAPTVPFGMSAYHMGFPGSITLRTATYLHVLEDNVQSLLHHGFDRFLFTNWHNGNEPVMNMALQTIPTRHPITFMSGISFYDLEDDDLFKELVKSDTWGHADELETSELLTLRPDRVKQDALAPGAVRPEGRKARHRFWRSGIRMSTDFLDFTSNGAVGDATRADLNDGWRMMQVIEQRLDQLICDLLDAPDDLVSRGRIPMWRKDTETQ